VQLHEDGTLVVSATDLVGYLECDHLVTLEELRARGELEKPFRDDPQLELVRKRGYAHEQAHIAQLQAQGRTVVEMQLREPRTPADLRVSEAETLAAMRAGADVIFQGTLFDGRWRGHPDFLVRRSDRPSDLGSWSYDVADTKLAKRVKAAAIVQMCVYADLLERLQGIPPETVSVVTGDRAAHDHRLADYAAYYRAAKRRFEARVFPASPVFEPPATYPEPVDHCRVCSWWQVCMDRRRADDHLSIVAGAATTQRRKLVAAGVPTLAALAHLPGDHGIRDPSGRVLERLRRQAALQLAKREDGLDRYELIPPNPDEPGKGLAALPPPSPLDVFFDIEADPWALDDGLEYLFGWAERDLANGESVFHALWAHDREQEKAMLEAFVDLVLERRLRDPGMHVYHYGGYESGALKRLMQRHATREDEIDVLLRGRVLVNLYDHVVRQGIRASVESYSIKKLERFYMPERVGPVTQAGFSVVEYERWMEEQDPAILQSIADYNRDDCVSNLLLRDWLEERRIEALESHPEWWPQGEIPRPGWEDGAPTEQLRKDQEETRAREMALREGVPVDRARRTPEQQGRWLLAGLLDWHRREGKPQWWDHYRLAEASLEELVTDGTALGELVFDADLGRMAKSALHRYRFDPAQETKIVEGKHAIALSPRADGPWEQATVLVVALDPLAGTVELKRNAGSPHPLALIPTKPYGPEPMRGALGRLADHVTARGIEGSGPFRAARDLVLRELPRIDGVARGAALAAADDDQTAVARRLGLGLDSTVLALQGPPGTGKTYTAARMILDLVERRKRVGVTAQSHRVIANLLEAVRDAAAEEGRQVRIAQRTDNGDEAPDGEGIERIGSPDAARDGLAARTWDVVGGTSWLWSREDMAGAIDTLFVDEAGQLSLATVCAVAGAAGSVVLLGDPNQLPQVSQGTHPEGAAASALEHLVGDAKTIAPERGLLLGTTYRLHPDVNAFISDAFYEGRLAPAAGNERQLVGEGMPVGGTGIRHVALEHEGAGNRSRVEAAWVADAIAALIGRRWRDRAGRERPMTADDVLVVAPYNAQVAEIVRAVERRLGVRPNVGTVDKFQGREAPVAIYSMTTSTPEEAPRELEFLYSGNRLNVAISRARGLAVLVANPALLRVACHTPEQMRLVNALCRLVEVAAEQQDARPATVDAAARPVAAPAVDLEGEALLLFPDLGPADRRRG
jgi:uncharacterized protein